MKNRRYPSLKSVGNLVKKFIEHARARHVSVFPIQNLMKYAVPLCILQKKHCVSFKFLLETQRKSLIFHSVGLYFQGHTLDNLVHTNFNNHTCEAVTMDMYSSKMSLGD